MLLEDRVETRPYFVMGDIVSNVVAGALVGGACVLLFSPQWNMVLAMIAGMVFGMAFSLPVAFLLSGVFGAMETLLPLMTTGMVAGMVVAMQASLTAVPFEDAAQTGGLCGVSVVVVTYLANMFIKPRAVRWTT